MKIIGSGQTGSKLAIMFDEKSILFSTATQDSANFSEFDIHEISQNGAGKRFSTGKKIWEDNDEVLRKTLSGVNNDKVIIFSSLGGGSGSSSLELLSRILLEQGNKVLVVGVLPHKKELNPPLANAVQSINSVMELISDVSVMLFDNERLLKKYENNWSMVNSHIIKRMSYLIKLLDEFSVNSYSPMTIDKSELDSVVFGGGFVDVTDDFLEEKSPTFDYGKINQHTKNLMVAMFVDVSVEKSQVDLHHKTLTDVTNKLAGKAKNARLVPGILRGKVEPKPTESGGSLDHAYITIASGLGIDDYLKQIEKMRDDAITRATAHASKTKSSPSLSKKESSILDI